MSRREKAIRRSDAALRGIVAAVGVAWLGGCATASKDIAAVYVSPMQYTQYDCDQLRSEADRIQRRVVQLGGRLDEAAKNDQILTGVGIVLFWPALFALGGTKDQEAEYARLKGEYDAVMSAAIAKKCPGIVPASSPAAAPATPALSAPAASASQ